MSQLLAGHKQRDTWRWALSVGESEDNHLRHCDCGVGQQFPALDWVGHEQRTKDELIWAGSLVS